MPKIEHENKGNDQRFAIYAEGDYAGELTFREEGNSMMIDHTEVEKEYEGKGFGKQLVMHAVDYAREHDMKIKPYCEYAHKVLTRDESYRDVLEDV